MYVTLKLSKCQPLSAAQSSLQAQALCTSCALAACCMTAPLFWRRSERRAVARLLLLVAFLLAPTAAQEEAAPAAPRPPLACAHAVWPEALAPSSLRPLLCDAPPSSDHLGCYGQPDNLTCTPAFVVIGFLRTATAKLFDLLRSHPRVRLPARSSQLLLKAAAWPAPLAAYRCCNGSEAGPLLFGDVSAAAVDAGGAPPHKLQLLLRRAEELLPPDARFVAAVRDPVARAFSHYRSHLLRGLDCGAKGSRPCFPAAAPFRTAVCGAVAALGGAEWLRWTAGAGEAPEPAPPPYAHFDILSPGLFGPQLQPWLDRFEATRVHVLDADELLRAPALCLARLLTHLRLGADGAAVGAGDVGRLYSRAQLHAPSGAAQAAEEVGEGEKETAAFLRALYAAHTRKFNLAHDLRLQLGGAAAEQVADASAEELEAAHAQLCGPEAGGAAG